MTNNSDSVRWFISLTLSIRNYFSSGFTLSVIFRVNYCEPLSHVICCNRDTAFGKLEQRCEEEKCEKGKLESAKNHWLLCVSLVRFRSISMLSFLYLKISLWWISFFFCISNHQVHAHEGLRDFYRHFCFKLPIFPWSGEIPLLYVSNFIFRIRFVICYFATQRKRDAPSKVNLPRLWLLKHPPIYQTS